MTLRLLWDTDPRGEKTVIERARYYLVLTVAPNSLHNDLGREVCYGKMQWFLKRISSQRELIKLHFSLEASFKTIVSSYINTLHT
jgi:hypothetical protein